MYNTKVQLWIENYLDGRPDGSAAFYKFREEFPAKVVENIKKAELESDIESYIKRRAKQCETPFGRRVEELFRKRLALKAEILEKAFEYVQAYCNTDPGDEPVGLVKSIDRVRALQQSIERLDTSQLQDERPSMEYLVTTCELGLADRLKELYPDPVKDGNP